MAHHYLIRLQDGARRCQDGKWRVFTGFGSMRACVKVYKRKGSAMRYVNAVNAWYDHPRVVVLTLEDNQVMDAAGHIYETNEETGNDRLTQRIEEWLKKLQESA